MPRNPGEPFPEGDSLMEKPGMFAKTSMTLLAFIAWISSWVNTWVDAGISRSFFS